MMLEQKLLAFITEELNENNKRMNAFSYDYDIFANEKNVRIVFNRNHKLLYGKLLHFCADNGLTIIKTQLGTYETIINIDERR